MRAKLRDVFLTLLGSYFSKVARDLYLPALPLLALQFEASDEMLKGSMTLFFVALFLARLFWPLFVERFGLHSVVGWSMSLFIVSTATDALYQSPLSFLAVRFLQGFCVGALPAILRGYVYEQHGETSSMRILSFGSAASVWAPSIAVLIGGYTVAWVGPQGLSPILIVIGALSWWTLHGLAAPHKEERQTDSMLTLYRTIPQMLYQRQFLHYTIPFALLSGGLSSYLTLAAFLYMEQFGLSAQQFAQLSFLVFSGFFVGKLVVGIYAKRFRSTQFMLVGVLISLVAPVWMLAAVYWECAYLPISLAAAMAVYLTGYGMILPVAKTAVMASGGKRFYSSTALLGVVGGLIGALMSAGVALLNLETALDLGILLLITCVAALLSFIATVERLDQL